MRLSTSLALAALGLAASALPAAAGTLLVPQQFSTIKSAVSAAKPYDTVLVSPKANGKPYSETITISTPHIVLQGQNNPVIDGSKLGKTLPDGFGGTTTTFPNGLEISADHIAVRGLTIQGFGFGDGPLSSNSAGINVGGAGYRDIEISGDTLQKNTTGLMIKGYTGSDPAFSGVDTYLTGYRVLGNLISGNSSGGAVLNGASVLVSGNRFLGNQSGGRSGDGLDVTGVSITVSGNESGGNTGYGMIVSTSNYDPAIHDPNNPAPTVIAFNSAHDNGAGGVSAEGTVTVTGNVVTGNLSGIGLSFADGSTVSGNVVTGSHGGANSGETGAGISVGTAYNFDSGVRVFLNQISGNGGDGISFASVGGGVIFLNSVIGNQGIGIHLSDFTLGGFFAPTTVTQNLAQHNMPYDAVDDTSAPFPDGDGVPTANIWTKNLFGTTNPPGLSK